LLKLLGNDIVDRLQAAKDSNWQRTGYLDKLFNSAEQELILTAADPSLLLWMLWTMKECVYKIVNRSTGIRRYAPKDFNCLKLDLNGSKADGTVAYKEQLFYTQSKFTPTFIHSIAVIAITEFPKISTYHSTPCAEYPAEFNRLHPKYKLDKNTDGLPVLSDTGTGINHPVSISHHGRYLAIVYSDFPLSAG
jgi:phosphopantetheinyl transferase (holo-ACP synthase)